MNDRVASVVKKNHIQGDLQLVHHS